MTVSASAARETTRAEPENLEKLIDTIQESCVSASVTDGVKIGDIMSAVGRRAYGPLLLAIGIVAISPASLIPGSTWFCAFLVFVIAGQMALGMKRPWLPKSALEIKLPPRKLADGLEKARPAAKWIDKFLKPRLRFLTKPPFVTLVALACVAAALVTVPLGFIPLAPFLPSAAIVLFGLGMTARDGLLLALGLALLGAAGAALYPVFF